MTEFKSCVQIKILQLPSLVTASLPPPSIYSLQSSYGQSLVDADLMQRG